MSGGAAPAGPSLGPGTTAPPRYGTSPTTTEGGTTGRPMADLPDDEPVDATSLLEDSRLDVVLQDFDDDLVALDEVKRRVREIAALLLVDRLRRTIGISSDPPTLHMSFTGNPGTGKTTVARRMGQVLHQLGYVRKGHVVSVTRDDLVGKYVGHTAPKTQEVLNRATGGVLFIDEAYHIYRVDNERDYGQETVELLLTAMENRRTDLVVIMAGYRDRMERFFTDVPGLSSRIGHHIHFPDYELDELMAIAASMNTTQGYRFDDDASELFRDYLDRRREQPRFANGRSVRNALDRLRMRQANRLWDAVHDGAKLTKGDLVTLQADDIRRSRVFDVDHP